MQTVAGPPELVGRLPTLPVRCNRVGCLPVSHMLHLSERAHRLAAHLPPAGVCDQQQENTAEGV